MSKRLTTIYQSDIISVQRLREGEPKRRKTMIKTIEQIIAEKEAGDYFAVRNDGKKYEATFTNDYGGVMFFCIPDEDSARIIGYEKR